MSTTISGTNGVTFPDSTSMQTGQQACKAWVNFNGTGTVAIRGEYNVSSITDRGTGQYTVNMTSALIDTNYSAVVSCDQAQSRVPSAVSLTTSQYPLDTETSAGAYIDAASVYSVVFR